jgi:hypothetical protein
MITGFQLASLLFKAQELGYPYKIIQMTSYEEVKNTILFTTDLDINEDSFHPTSKHSIYISNDTDFPADLKNYNELNQKFTEKLEIKKKRENALVKLTPEEIKLLGIQNV